MTCKRTDHNPNMDHDPKHPMDHWTCELARENQKQFPPFGHMQVTFSMGIGHNGAQPDLPGVLSCLASDASSVESDDFEDWCSELGYDTDSRKAERTYKACKAEAVKLEKFLGREAFQTLCWHTERD